MKTRYATSTINVSLLSLVIITLVGNPALAQDSNNAATAQTPATSVLGDGADAADTQSRDDDCINLDVGSVDNPTNRRPSTPTTLGTDARIDPDRLDCLDAHRDDPHADNLRGQNPLPTPTTERPDLSTDEDIRDEVVED